MPPNKSVVFARGISADGSCLSRLVPPLRAKGYDVLASQRSLDNHQDDVDCVVRCIGRATRPVVLAGHSRGGALITATDTDDRVCGLVHIAALGLVGAEPCKAKRTSSPKSTSLVSSEAEARSGCSQRPSPTSRETPPRRGRQAVLATTNAATAQLCNQKGPRVAWWNEPSWGVVATISRIDRPDLERFAALRMGAADTELAASHVAMLSQPVAVPGVRHDPLDCCVSPARRLHRVAS